MSMIPVLGAIAGELLSKGDRKKQEALEERAMRLYGDISLPTLQKLEAQLVSSGEWDRMPSDFGNQSARNEAISRLMEAGRPGGQDAQSQLATEQARLAGANQAARGRAAVRQEAQARGMGGASELLGQLTAQQAGAQTASLGGLQSAASAQQRALQALAQGGAMAAQAEGQDSSMAMRKAAERDAIARFNSQMNWQQQTGNNQIAQQGFNNRLDLAGAQSGAMLRRANQYGRNAQSTRDMWGGIGQGVEDAAQSGMQMMMGMPPGALGGGAAPTTFAGSQAKGSAGVQDNPFAGASIANGAPQPARVSQVEMNPYKYDPNNPRTWRTG